MLHLHRYRKRKKSGGACKRSKPLNSAADAADSGGGNHNTETNGIILSLIALLSANLKI